MIHKKHILLTMERKLVHTPSIFSGYSLIQYHKLIKDNMRFLISMHILWYTNHSRYGSLMALTEIRNKTI